MIGEGEEDIEASHRAIAKTDPLFFSPVPANLVLLPNIKLCRLVQWRKAQENNSTWTPYHFHCQCQPLPHGKSSTSSNQGALQLLQDKFRFKLETEDFIHSRRKDLGPQTSTTDKALLIFHVFNVRLHNWLRGSEIGLYRMTIRGVFLLSN